MFKLSILIILITTLISCDGKRNIDQDIRDSRRFSEDFNRRGEINPRHCGYTLDQLVKPYVEINIASLTLFRDFTKSKTVSLSYDNICFYDDLDSFCPWSCTSSDRGDISPSTISLLNQDLVVVEDNDLFKLSVVADCADTVNGECRSYELTLNLFEKFRKIEQVFVEKITMLESFSYRLGVDSSEKLGPFYGDVWLLDRDQSKHYISNEDISKQRLTFKELIRGESRFGADSFRLSLPDLSESHIQLQGGYNRSFESIEERDFSFSGMIKDVFSQKNLSLTVDIQSVDE